MEPRHRLAASVLLAAAACEGASRQPESDSTSMRGAQVVSSSVSSSGDQRGAPDASSPCPHDGRWALCSIETRLRQSGFVLKRQNEPARQRPGFSVPPTIYTVGKSRLEIFLYSDSAALARDMAKLDTLSVAPTGTTPQWGDVPPVLVRSANLAAVLLSQNQRQAERLSLALTAGPPQPGSPR